MYLLVRRKHADKQGKLAMNLFCALLVWILMSGLGFLALPLLQKNAESLVNVSVAVLSGPIAGVISAATNGALGNAFPALIFGCAICAFGVAWWRKRRTFLSFSLHLYCGQ